MKLLVYKKIDDTIGRRKPILRRGGSTGGDEVSAKNSSPWDRFNFKKTNMGSLPSSRAFIVVIACMHSTD